jgi:predicted transcriptional regulator
MQEWYIEVSDSVKRKVPPEIVNVSDLPRWQREHQDSELGLFRSIYEYPTEDPYVGGVISDFYVDLDCEKDPDKARKEAVALVKTLINDYSIPEEIINIAFSGMKGISISIGHEVFNVEARADLPMIWKSIVKHLASKLNLKTVDTKVYERRRLWRLLNSKHQKSGLYKIPLTFTELEKLSIEEIKEKAVKHRPQPFVVAQGSPVPKAVSLFQEHQKKIEEWKQKRKESFGDIEIKSLGEDPPCVQKLFEQGADEESRNISLFQLAVYWSQKGLSEEEIVKLGYGFAKHCKLGVHPFPEGEEIERTVYSAYVGVQDGRYSVGCSSETFALLCDRENCPLFNPLKQEWMKVGEPISYDEWREVITKNFPHLWPYAEACASAIAILLIKDALPFCLVLQGVPGCGKTTTLSFFYNFLHSHKTDKFTPASFVSHAPQKSEKELEKVDLLPKLKHKVLITSDLSPLFGLIPERLKENLSTLTRVLDGHGLTTESGIHGTRGYSGDYMFTWIAATTPIPYAVWDLFGNLGARMYFHEVGTERKTVDEHLQELRQATYRQKVKECNEASLRFLKKIWQTGEVEWNPEKDPEEVLRRIVQLALLLVRLRGKVNVVVKQDYEGEKTYYSTPTIEHADRAREALYQLARGHAIIKGRKQVTIADLPVAVEVTLSSAPYDRVNAFKYLLENEGSVTTSDLMRDLKCSRRTAIRSMKTLEILELVDLEKTSVETEFGTRTGYTMRLKEEFKWFTSGEFRKLWRIKKVAPIQIELSERTEVVEKLTSFKDMFKEGENKVNG